MPDESDEGSRSQRRWVPPVYKWPNMSDGELDLIRKRQRERSRLLAILLGLFVVLMFAITIAKLSVNQ